MQKQRKIKTKKESLFLRNRVETLFSRGKSFVVYPYRIVYFSFPQEELLRSLVRRASNEAGFEILISVPKKKVKRAVDRHLCKRRTREAFRLQNERLRKKAKEQNKHLYMALLQIKNGVVEYPEVEKAIKRIVKKMESFI